MTNEDNLPPPDQQSDQQQSGQQQPAQPEPLHRDPNTSLVDELGIVDIYEPIADLDGKIYCTAGRNAPVAEFTEDYLIMHPPQMPLYETGPEEEIVLAVDDRGIVLDEFGDAKKIPTAKYKGHPIYYFGEQKEGTLKHYAVIVTEDNSLYFIFNADEERLTTDVIYRMRNKSVNGEISKFPGLHCDLDEATADDDRVDPNAMVNTEVN